MTKHARRLGRPVDAGDTVLSVRISSQLADGLYALTREDGSTLSGLIREGLREYVNRRMCNLVPENTSETSGHGGLVRTWRHAR